MAEKKYFWLKLKETFFSDKEIKKLRRIAGGDTYTIIYLKLQLLSIKNDGMIFYEGIEDTFEDEMASVLNEDVENVRIAIMFLQKHKCMEALSEDEYLLPKAVENIGKESTSSERVRRHRANQKALHCNGDVTKCNTEIEIEKEIKEELNIREEIEIEKEKESVTHSVTPEKFYSDNFAPIAPLIADYIFEYVEWGMEDALIIESMKIAVEKNIRNWSYVDGILKNMRTAGFKKLEQYEAHEAERKRKETEGLGGSGKNDRKNNADDEIINKGITRV